MQNYECAYHFLCARNFSLTKDKGFQGKDTVEYIFVWGVGRTWRKKRIVELFYVCAHQLFGWPDPRGCRWIIWNVRRRTELHSVFVGKPEGKRVFLKYRCRWEDLIKINLTEIGWKCVEWINLTLNSGRNRAFWIQQWKTFFLKMWDFFTSWRNSRSQGELCSMTLVRKEVA